VKPAKSDIYKFIKIAGMVSFIPLVLLSGPIAGYLAGDFLADKLSMPALRLACLGIGTIAAVFEAFKIIRLVLKLNKQL